MADEIFVVLEGRSLFRYGDRVHEIRPGDCISCPADTGIAHQIANPATADGTGDLVCLAIVAKPPGEVCTYRDSGSLVIDALDRRGCPARGRTLRGASTSHAISDAGPDAPV